MTKKILIIFIQYGINLQHVISDHLCPETFKQVQEICEHYMKDEYGFIVIDNETEFENGRHQEGFNHNVDATVI